MHYTLHRCKARPALGRRTWLADIDVMSRLSLCDDQHCMRLSSKWHRCRQPLPSSDKAHAISQVRGVHIGSVCRVGRSRLGGVLNGVAPGHAVVPQRVARPQQVAGVAVQGRVGRCVRQQRQNGAAHALQRPGGRPRALQDVEANLARLWVERSGAKSGRSESWAAGHRRSRTSDTGRYLTFQWMLGWNTCRSTPGKQGVSRCRGRGERLPGDTPW